MATKGNEPVDPEKKQPRAEFTAGRRRRTPRFRRLPRAPAPRADEDGELDEEQRRSRPRALGMLATWSPAQEVGRLAAPAARAAPKNRGRARYRKRAAPAAVEEGESSSGGVCEVPAPEGVAAATGDDGGSGSGASSFASHHDYLRVTRGDWSGRRAWACVDDGCVVGPPTVPGLRSGALPASR